MNKNLTQHPSVTEDGHRMAPLALILIFLLHFEGLSGKRYYLYHTPGQDVTMTCDIVSDRKCSNINWLYNAAKTETIVEVSDGNIIKSSVRAARLSLGPDCSVVIRNITAEDVGLYTCRRGRNPGQDAFTYLSVLTISLFPPDTGPQMDEVTLQCSLLRFSKYVRCRENSFSWMDEAGTLLLGEQSQSETQCVSRLTVKRQSLDIRTYTCWFVDEENKVKIQTEYTRILTTDKTYIYVGAAVGLLLLLLLLLLIITAVFIKYRTGAKVDVQQLAQTPNEHEGNVTYVTVGHVNQVDSVRKVKEEEKAIYSTVKTS
ncbi:uncharacterized protein LOC113137524 isoform X2 [Mastacembelus armatus]|uniref:uncharacterized protein LOC113137524 isoform X2 n=1 Tax=Mastacembelus armatus TaxID=205130 RepID=UPI000E4540E6|nr:uncharacterized protein LOC113137524 isoform X2 [Mastacembelus armatus]